MKKTILALIIAVVVLCIIAVAGVLIIAPHVVAPPAPTERGAALGVEPATATTVPATPTLPTPTPTPLPPQPPILLRRSPDRGQEQGLTAPIKVLFDQAMDKASVESAFDIEPRVAGELAWDDDRRLVFTPAEPGFERAATYQVTIDETAKSAAGLTLRQPIQFKFTTVGFLEVTDVQPAPRTTEVDMDAVVTVIFNRPVVPLTAIEDQGNLPHPLTFVPPVQGEGEWLNTSIYRFTPTDGFLPATEYQARIAAGLEDTTGGLLAEDYIWTFTTKMPAVVRTVPRDKAKYVNPSTVISVTFNQPVDHDSAEANFALVNAETKEAVAGTFRWQAQGLAEEQGPRHGEKTRHDAGARPTVVGREVMGFVPDEPLELDTVYRGQVKRGVLAAAGEGGTRRDYTWDFKIIGRPTIVSTNPKDGEKRADPYGAVEIRFSNPMDRDSINDNFTILPRPTHVYTYWSRSDTRLTLSFGREPSTAYTITLSGDLRGRYGHPLGQAHTIRFTTRALDPSISLINVGKVGTYNAYTQTMAYVQHINVPELEFSLYRLDKATFITLNASWRAWDKFTPDEGDLVRRWSQPVESELNQRGVAGTLITGESGEGLAPGLYYLEVTAPGVEYPPRQMMVVSPVNVVLKQTQTEGLVWVTDLQSGQPLPSVRVKLYDDESRLVGDGRTDDDGVLQVQWDERDPYQELFVFVGWEDDQPGPDFGVAVNRWDDGIGPCEFNLPTETYREPYSAYFYTDRAIYRPGQKVYFKGIFRADDDARYSLPTGVLTVPVTISDDQGKELYSEDLPLSEMGTVYGELALSDDAALGYYNISARLDDQTFGTGFRVAEYRKPEFQVKVETDRDAYVQGDEIKVTVEATYFFGGPVANARLDWAVLSDDYVFNWQGRGWYDFTDYDWTRSRYYGSSGELIGQGQGETDEQGRFTFSVPADVAEKTLSQLFTIEATVTDVNDQQVSNRTGAIVHKGLYYIGLAPQRYVGNVGRKQGVNVITVDWDSEAVSDVELTVVWYKHRWYSVRRKAEDGRFYWDSGYEDIAVFTDTVRTDRDGKAESAYTPTEGGVYKIAARGLDERENEVRSSTFMWVSGRKYVNWRQENNDRIDLITDRKSYKPGDVAEILIPSPYQGEHLALMTIERGHIMEHKLLTLRTNSELIKLPIKSEYAPNVYVSVVLVKGMDETNPLASFKIGYAALPVSTEEKELAITITPDKDMAAGEHYSPGETVTYDIEARDYKGDPVDAEFSLALADLSVLSLAEQPGPDIVEHFYRERGVGVGTSASLVKSVDRVNVQVAPEAKGGGGGPGAEGGVRRRFPDTAYWNPAVRTGDDGQVRVEVQLPDNLTTWRLDARAVTADTLVGSVKTDVLSTKDLLVRPVAPRFFVIGDRAELGAIVHNNTDAPLEVEVSFTADGLEITGGQKSITVPAKDKVRVDWPVEVQNAEQARLLFSAKEKSSLNSPDSLSDAIEITLPVYHYTTPEVVATSGQVEPDQPRVEVIALPDRYDPTQGELTVQLDPSLAASTREGLKYLEHYPWECIEQTMSRFLPNVVTYRTLKKLGIRRPDLETALPQQVAVGLQRIYAYQHYDGGWGWWLADESSPYLTAYVLFGLNQADQAGFAVDAEVMDRAASFLRESLGRRVDTRAPWRANTQAFVLYVLAESGHGDLGRTVALYEKRDVLGNYGKAYLAMALDILAPKERTRVDALLSDLTSEAIVSATGAHWEEDTIDYWTMNTNTRSTAIVLDALSRLAPENALVPQTVRWLMVTRKEGHWETTQETAWALIALTDYMAASGELEADYSYQVYFNGELLGQRTVDADNLDEPQVLRVAVADMLADQGNQLWMERLEPAGGQTGKGRLYYAAYLRYFLPVEDVKALDRGIIVVRKYCRKEQAETSTDARCKAVSEAKVGDVIEVHLTLIAPNDLHYVVVEDPLPAGTEAIDTSLKTTSVTAEEPRAERTSDRWRYWWWWLSHAELRDEKVGLFATYLRRGTYEYTYLIRASVPGEFLTMPATAYEMYFPEVWGRSDGGKFTVSRGE